jgi:hypothetical protein
MVRYLDEIVKRIKKGQIPKEIFVHINNAFSSIDLTKDLNLFDNQLPRSRAARYERLVNSPTQIT